MVLPEGVRTVVRLLQDRTTAPAVLERLTRTIAACADSGVCSLLFPQPHPTRHRS